MQHISKSSCIHSLVGWLKKRSSVTKLIESIAPFFILTERSLQYSISHYVHPRNHIDSQYLGHEFNSFRNWLSSDPYNPCGLFGLFQKRQEFTSQNQEEKCQQLLIQSVRHWLYFPEVLILGSNNFLLLERAYKNQRLVIESIIDAFLPKQDDTIQLLSVDTMQNGFKKIARQITE